MEDLPILEPCIDNKFQTDMFLYYICPWSGMEPEKDTEGADFFF